MDVKLLEKLDSFLLRYKFLESKLINNEVLQDNSLFVSLNKEYSSLKNLVNL